ncbi:MAG: hypothetical protein A7316_01550 [Candidatus Altiarchaeales archaeon WOR_SM1_86-2]|nr:MAG: hypothetical protein A7316_01550 [Candidatus Altiarchaeales archaeon WOR_SM1_86-2]
MKALILAGGEGTRLRPLTNNIPKCMVPIDEKPFMKYIISFLKKQNIREIVMSVGYLRENIIKYFGDGKSFGIRVEYAVEDELRGTAGAIKNAENFIDDRFLVLNGDTFFSLNLMDFKKFHMEKNAMCTIALTKLNSADRYGTIDVRRSGEIMGFFEKKMSGKSIINAGFYLFELEMFDHLPKKGSLETDVFPLLVGKIYGYISKGYFIDIGTHESYDKIKSEIDLIRDYIYNSNI